MRDYRPPFLAAIGAFTAVLALYGLTLGPSTALWDASEYIATANILGIPHPPGNPLFVVLARTWIVLLSPLGLPVPVRVNLFAAVTSAAASGFLFLVSHRILSACFSGRSIPLVGASAAVLVSATTFTMWNQSTVNEKVYTVSVLVIVAVTWLAFRWYDRRDEPGSTRTLLLGVYLLCLGSTNHLMSVLPVPALALLLLLGRPRVLLKGDFWVRVLAAVIVGVSFNLFLPIRAELDPVINEGDPVCESLGSATVAVFTQGRAGCGALGDVLLRRQYAKPPVFEERQAPFRHQILNYLQYFDWQWARGLDADERPGGGRVIFSFLFLLLGTSGLLLVWRADRLLFLYVATLLLTLTVALVFYLNFKYGFSLAPEVTRSELHEVRERDYFFLASFLVWGGLAGVGLAGWWGSLARRIRHPRALLLASPVLLLSLLPLGLNWRWASRAGDYAARDWAYDLLTSVEPYGVLFTNGDNDTFPLWYLQEVEGIRRDVTVVVVQYLWTDWYPKQLQELTLPERQRSFVPASSASPHDVNARQPTAPILGLHPDEMDRIVGGRFQDDLSVTLGGTAVVYPGGSSLTRAELLALAIIRDSIRERPIHFSSRGGLMNDLGLGARGIRHGLTTKLHTGGDPAGLPGVVRVDERLGGEFVDLERSLHLARKVYSYRGLRDRDVWADRATLNIPWHFYALFVQLANAAEQAGLDPELVRELRDEIEPFQTVSLGGRLGTPS